MTPHCFDSGAGEVTDGAEQVRTMWPIRLANLTWRPGHPVVKPLTNLAREEAAVRENNLPTPVACESLNPTLRCELREVSNATA